MVILGIDLGAGLYETVVVVPVWSHAGAESIIGYYELNMANPQFSLNAGPKFWSFLTPAVGLFAIATLATSFKTSPQHRKWRIAGSSLAVFMVACTFAWFVPNIIKLFYAVPNMPAADIATTAKWWVNLNYGRVVIGITAWIWILRAFAIPQDRKQ